MELQPPMERADPLTDPRTLVERARQGDAAAQRELYDTHVDRIYRLAYRLTGRDDLAREMTQDTFARAFTRLSEFRGQSAFGTWLHTIATSVTLNELKRRKRVFSREAPLEEAVTITGRGAPSDPILRDRLAAAIAGLPEKSRVVFMMHDAEGFTHEEIAATLGVTVGTSKAQLFRSRARLREALAAFSGEWKA